MPSAYSAVQGRGECKQDLRTVFQCIDLHVRDHGTSGDGEVPRDLCAAVEPHGQRVSLDCRVRERRAGAREGQRLARLRLLGRRARECHFRRFVQHLHICSENVVTTGELVRPCLFAAAHRLNARFDDIHRTLAHRLVDVAVGGRVV